ncbi:hypothetical protein MTP99_011320, partial [Tenebrio molitor]
NIFRNQSTHIKPPSMIELLELVAATSWFWTFSIGFLISIVGSIAIWYDRKTCERGGRPITLVRQSIWWQLMRYYFKHQLVRDENATFDSKRNYLFACFPHGMLPVGTFASFVDGYHQFWMPVIRELFFVGGGGLGVGALHQIPPEQRERGKYRVDLDRGADESKYSKPGKYKIILNKRKGFVKMALQTGSPLVPVISFGETDVLDQLDFPGFGFLRDLVKNTLQIWLVIPKGTYLVCPNRVRVSTVVGRPIDVEKTDNPTSEQIDKLHQEFADGIKKLFESTKAIT